MIEVQYNRGLHLPELDLWLDPQIARPFAFVSHAHSDHFARHETILCSEVTSSLLRDRFSHPRTDCQSPAFHVPIVRDGFRIRLLPAGHIPGSAMIHVTRTSDNASLLYTGDFKTRRSRISEAVSFLSANTLIIESTFGLPAYEFPSPMEVEAEVLRFIHDCFADNVTPVLLGYSLGKSQEVLALLAENEIPALLHPAVVAMTAACRSAGVTGLPHPVEFTGTAAPGHVVITPPHALRTKLFEHLGPRRAAMLSGWAVQPESGFRFGVDSMIPFSDHADHPGLLECIQRVRPSRVLTVHGYAKEFAAELRSRDIDAWCASGGDQLELPIIRPSHKPSTARAPWQKRVVCPLADFSDLCRLVEKTGSRVAKLEFIANYLAGLEDDENLRIATLWLTREFLPSRPGDSNNLLNTSTLRHALLAIPGARDERFREIHRKHKNLATVAKLFLTDLQLHPEALDIPGAAKFVLELRYATESMDRIRALARRLSTLHPSEGETIVKLLTGNLRTAADSKLVHEAIAKAFLANPDALHHAIRITRDSGTAAVLAKHHNLDQATPPEKPDTPPPELFATAELPLD